MKTLEILGLAAAGLLFLIWPIPHTVTLRDLLLVLNLALLGYLAWRKGWPREVLRELRVPAALLAVVLRRPLPARPPGPG